MILSNIDSLFNLCVDIIKEFGNLFGLSDNAANILIFCVIWPIVTLYFIALAVLNSRGHSKRVKAISIISAVVTIAVPIGILALIFVSAGLSLPR